MLVIDAAVSHLENLSCLEEYLCNLGKKHQAVGVKIESFSVRCLLLSCCSPACSPQLSPSPCTHLLGSAEWRESWWHRAAPELPILVW